MERYNSYGRYVPQFKPALTDAQERDDDQQTTRLNQYFIQNVQIPRKTSEEIRKKIRSVVQDLAQRMHDIDGRFSHTLIPIGSSHQGLKVKQADEFDFSIQLLGIQPCWGRADSSQLSPCIGVGIDSNNQKYIHQNANPLPQCVDDLYQLIPAPTTSQLFSSKQDENLVFNGYLIPLYVKTRLRSILKKGISMRHQSDDITVHQRQQGPAINFTIVYKKSGHVNIEVDIDFAVVICAKLPFEGFTTWPNSDQWTAGSHRWPSIEYASKVKSEGINLVAKKDLYWQLSFAHCEKMLVKPMERDGIRKKVHRIIKSLCEEVCKGIKGDKPVGWHSPLSSYMLKNAWLLECEKFPSTELQWQPRQLYERYENCMSSLQQYIHFENLPMYFCRRVNLLKNKDINGIKEIFTQMKLRGDKLCAGLI